MSDLTPTQERPGLHVVMSRAPSASWVCRCGVTSSGTGRGQVYEVVGEWDRHRSTECSHRQTPAPTARTRGRR